MSEKRERRARPLNLFFEQFQNCFNGLRNTVGICADGIPLFVIGSMSYFSCVHPFSISACPLAQSRSHFFASSISSRRGLLVRFIPESLKSFVLLSL